MCFDDAGDLLDFAFAEIRRRPDSGEHDDAGIFDMKIDGAGEPDRFIEPCRRAAIGGTGARHLPSQRRLDDKRPARRRASRA